MFFEKKNNEEKIIKSVNIFDTVHIERKIQAKYKDDIVKWNICRESKIKLNNAVKAQLYWKNVKHSSFLIEVMSLKNDQTQFKLRLWNLIPIPQTKKKIMNR